MNFEEYLYYGFSAINLVMAAFAIYKFISRFFKEPKLDLPTQRIMGMFILTDGIVIVAQCYSLYNEGIMWPHKMQGLMIWLISLMFAKYLKDKG